MDPDRGLLVSAAPPPNYRLQSSREEETGGEIRPEALFSDLSGTTEISAGPPVAQAIPNFREQKSVIQKRNLVRAPQVLDYFVV